MQNKWKFVLGVIFCIIGVIILSTSFLIGRFIPGGLILLAIGLMLISRSKENKV
ncbi:hypothetical protein [Methanobacterium sp. ACI-7]|uniref:hypothetical protein n=1 Tax=unclassified Methanobacterium TaxID=2627676 RepID=UPI0039C0D84A